MARSTSCRQGDHDACTGKVIMGAPEPVTIEKCKCKCGHEAARAREAANPHVHDFRCSCGESIG